MENSHLNEQVEGYPSFVRWSADNGTELNWWAPTRTGDDDLDFATGAAHFTALMDVLKGVHGPWRDYQLSLLAPGNIDPRIALGSVVGAMTSCGQMEVGFLNALAEKGYRGRPPAVGTAPNPMEQVAQGEDHAHACIEIARMAATPSVIVSELMIVIESDSDRVAAGGFVWTVCGAAIAGALH